jgi:hypothetical protein
MSKPTNSAARNQMSEFERQCYDWGWQANEDRIVKIIESRRNYDCTCKCDCHAHPAPCHACIVDGELIELIKEGQK